MRQRALGKIRCGVEEKGAAGTGQGTNDGVAVNFGKQRRRPAGGVVTGALLALQKHDSLRLGEMRGYGSTGHTGADHDDVGLDHWGFLLGEATPVRERAI